jgi:uncharacterized membrane protein (DUF2068 family)
VRLEGRALLPGSRLHGHGIQQPLLAGDVTTPSPPPAGPHGALRAVAFIEAAKGAVVLLAATGLLSLVHRDLNDLAARLVRHAHLNPASHYPHIFLDAVSHVGDSRLVMLALGAAAYSAVRFVEAWGLFRERAWAEWLAAVGGAIYLPVEIGHLVRRPHALGAAVFVANLVVVLVVVVALVRRRGGFRR